MESLAAAKQSGVPASLEIDETARMIRAELRSIQMRALAAHDEIRTAIFHSRRGNNNDSSFSAVGVNSPNERAVDVVLLEPNSSSCSPPAQQHPKETPQGMPSSSLAVSDDRHKTPASSSPRARLIVAPMDPFSAALARNAFPSPADCKPLLVAAVSPSTSARLSASEAPTEHYGAAKDLEAESLQLDKEIAAATAAASESKRRTQVLLAHGRVTAEARNKERQAIQATTERLAALRTAVNGLTRAAQVSSS